MNSIAMNPAAVRILCAIVTYNEALSQTTAFRSLSALPERWRVRLEICSVANEGSNRCDRPQAVSRSTTQVAGMPVLDIATHCNGGTALGYNLAVNELAESACDYILFLNADSTVSEELLDAFDATIGQPLEKPIAAAPTLVASGRVVSPFRKRGFEHPFWIIGSLFCHRSVFPAGFSFPADYWLDGMDYWLSHVLWNRSITVAQLPVRIEHQLSVVQGFKSLPAWRYRNILSSEIRFLRAHGKRSRGVELIVRLRAAVRCVLHGRIDLLREILRTTG